MVPFAATTTTGIYNSSSTDSILKGNIYKTVRSTQRIKYLRHLKGNNDKHVRDKNLALKETLTQQPASTHQRKQAAKQKEQELKDLSKELIKLKNENIKQSNQKGTAKRRQCKWQRTHEQRS